MIFSCVGYKSLIVPSKEYDHSSPVDIKVKNIEYIE